MKKIRDTDHSQSSPSLRHLRHSRSNRLPSVCRASTGRIQRSVRLPHRGCCRFVFLHPTSFGMAIVQLAQYCGDWTSYCFEHLFWCTRTDHGSLDLQGGREEEGIPHWSLGKCGLAFLCGCWLHLPIVLLQDQEQDVETRGRGEAIQILSLLILSSKKYQVSIRTVKVIAPIRGPKLLLRYVMSV